MKEVKEDPKSIILTVYFLTDKELPEKIINKTAFWANGFIHLKANNTKGIKRQKENFHYLDDIPRAIRVVLSKEKLLAVDDMTYSKRVKRLRKK